MIEAISIGLLGLTMTIHIVIILLWNFNFKTHQNRFEELPKVTIIIACRNEANNISSLLDNLWALDYPKEKTEILIGNDGSEDETLMLLNSYSETNIQVFDINNNINQLKGKMNILAQLVAKSTGEFLLFSDADMLHPNDWIHSMLEAHDEKTGIVVGFTSIKAKNLLSNFQQTDYVFGQGMMKVLMDLGKPVYASGNNMLVSRKAYEAAGGFEEMDFHLTEDVLLLKAITEKGYNVKTSFNSDNISQTLPLNSWKEIIYQRKRWMSAFDLMPFSALVFPLLKLSFLPSLLILSFFQLHIAAAILLTKVFINIIFSISIKNKLILKSNYLAAAFYDFYELIIYLPALFLRVFSKSSIWKNRNLS